MKWCQVRVFIATCLGVLAGQLVAKLLHFTPGYAVLPFAFIGWLGGNALNAWIAARSARACQPLFPPDSLREN
ncbi:MAG TPA: hypothetical protein VIO32_00270 [Candidatus Baltobacteraceae bacterium]